MDGEEMYLRRQPKAFSLMNGLWIEASGKRLFQERGSCLHRLIGVLCNCRKKNLSSAIDQGPHSVVFQASFPGAFGDALRSGQRGQGTANIIQGGRFLFYRKCGFIQVVAARYPHRAENITHEMDHGLRIVGKFFSPYDILYGVNRGSIIFFKMDKVFGGWSCHSGGSIALCEESGYGAICVIHCPNPDIGREIPDGENMVKFATLGFSP